MSGPGGGGGGGACSWVWGEFFFSRYYLYLTLKKNKPIEFLLSTCTRRSSPSKPPRQAVASGEAVASNRAPPLSGRFAAEMRTRAASQPCRRGPLPSLCLDKKETSFPAIPAPKPRRFSVAARRCDQSAGASGGRVRISGLDSAADGAGAARPKKRTSNSPIRWGRAEEKKLDSKTLPPRLAW